MAVKIFIDLDATGQWITFQSPYNPEFIAGFKERIPGACRRWIVDRKVWAVTRAKWQDTLPLFAQHYVNPEMLRGPAAEQAEIELLVDSIKAPEIMDYTKLGVRSDAPGCVIHASYLALEAVWGSSQEERLKEMGIYPLSQIRDAYKRICAHRNMKPQAPVPLRMLINARIGDIAELPDGEEARKVTIDDLFANPHGKVDPPRESTIDDVTDDRVLYDDDPPPGEWE